MPTAKLAKDGTKRGRKNETSKRQLMAAIKGSRGLITNVAKRLGNKDWNTAQKYIKLYAPASTEAMLKEREIITDIAEDRLVDSVKKGEQWGVTFWLRTIGRKRGFSERTELVGAADAEPIRIELIFVKAVKDA